MKSHLHGLCLLCALFIAAYAHAEEPDGRVQLLIRADPKGAAKLSFQWTQLEGPPVKIANPTAGKFENGKWVSDTYFIPTEPGKYVFEISVRNEDGEETKGRIVRVVDPPAAPPVAVAGKDQLDKKVGEIVRVNGVSSKAADGRKIEEWKWTLIDSPEKFKPLDPKLLKERAFDFKATHAGNYHFQLVVSDGKRWSEPSQMMITVKPDSVPPKIEVSEEPPKKAELPEPPKIVERKKPEVKVVVDPGRTVKLGELLILDGSRTIVEESAKPEFYWRTERGFVRGLAADKSRPFSKNRSDVMNYPVWNCKPDAPGEYAFVLEVTTYDETGKNQVRTESAPVVFTVTAPPPPKVEPAPVAEADPKPPKTKSVAEERATTVTPPDEKPPVAVAPPKETPKPPKEEPKPEVKKNHNPPPVAKIFAERTTVEIGETVKLDGTRSKDPNGEKLEYIWGPVPGKRAPKSWAGKDGPQVEFRAEEEGEYHIALIVKAGDAFSEPAQIAITVGPANQAPKIRMPKSIEGLIGEQIRIEADAVDPENDPMTYKWVSIDPPNLVMKDQKGNDMSINPALVFVPARAGTYVFKVTVTDSHGASDSSQVMIGIKERINRPPVAIIDGPKTASVGERVRLSAVRSTDPEKKTLTYTWTQEVQPGDPVIPGDMPKEKDKMWEFIPTVAGRYLVSLVVSDGINKSDPERFELNVTVNNNAPIAHITGPAGGRVIIGETMVLDGSASSDPENDKLSYKWRLLPGKIQLELTDADQPKCSIKATALGSARVELVVTDGTTTSEPALFDVHVGRQNAKPVAKITAPDVARVGSYLELSAAESTDADGDELNYIWSQTAEGGPEIGVRGKDLRKKTLKFRADKPGTYVINLEVVDSELMKSDPVSHKIEVKGANKPPRAVASRVGIEPIVAGGEVKLSGRGSLDPEGSPLTYKWKQITGAALELPAEQGEILNIVPKESGLYEFDLIVSDGDNESAPAKVAFSVRGPNNVPVAVIADVVSGEIGERITLDGSASRDGDGDKLEYRWTQISGPEAKFAWRGQGKAKTEVVLPKDDEYVFELKVFDGKEWSEPRKVVVKPRAPNIPPLAAVLLPQLRTEENVETILDATPSSDPDKGPHALSYSWRQTGGPRQQLQSEGALAKFTPQRAGTYTFEVKVSDGKNESTPAAVQVDVLKAGTLPVAVAEAAPNPIKACPKGVANPDPSYTLILDGRKSHSKAGALTYSWKQAGGVDLRLNPASLTRDRVGLRVFIPGMYRFMLVVSDGQNTSMPAYVDVKVIDGNESTAKPATSEDSESKARAPAAREPAKTTVKEQSNADKPESAPVAEKSNAAPTVKESANEGLLLPPPKGSSAAASEPPEKTEAQRAISELAQKVDPEAERQLIAALSNEDKEIRSTAAAALYRRGINSIPALIGVLESGDALARKEAHWALRELTHETIEMNADKWKKWWAAQPASKSIPMPVSDK
ncbi:MAG TPA: HEAT repeat domain-containing protein [Planctomycetota bacterium]|nr:HEAT repeat domain-containing protein [Planctomycetota bacterium]